MNNWHTLAKRLKIYRTSMAIPMQGYKSIFILQEMQQNQEREKHLPVENRPDIVVSLQHVISKENLLPSLRKCFCACVCQHKHWCVSVQALCVYVYVCLRGHQSSPPAWMPIGFFIVFSRLVIAYPPRDPLRPPRIRSWCLIAKYTWRVLLDTLSNV